MKKSSTRFLQVVIVLIAAVTLIIMIHFPTTEGRAVNLSLFKIYSDPFIIYGYLASIAFFIALYQVFKLLGNIGDNKVFSLSSVKSLKTIKYCSIILAVLIVMAVIFIKLYHNVDDDPAGFIAIGTLTTFISIVIATAAAVLEKLLQNALDIKSENDLTV